MKNPDDTISISWHIDDIREEYKGAHKLTDDDCREILRRMKANHDATIGINWEVISVVTDFYLREKHKK